MISGIIIYIRNRLPANFKVILSQTGTIKEPHCNEVKEEVSIVEQLDGEYGTQGNFKFLMGLQTLV